jgi:hypothetical protein
MPGIVVRADDAHRALEERRTEELEAALRALVAVEPIVRHGPADYDCHHCNTEGAGSWWAVRPEEVEHSGDCPWVRARALLGGEA